MAEVCVWTRMPDRPIPFDLMRVRYTADCTEKIAAGVHAIYPDNCPNCGRSVAIKSTDSGGSEHGD
jgi:hypothetical protein